tara:strand:- start:491 stop:610 length:120 start_codon:yes stop_codon:yes gene_type:complete
LKDGPVAKKAAKKAGEETLNLPSERRSPDKTRRGSIPRV